MIISVIGLPKSGKGEFSAALCVAIAQVRQELEGKKKRPRNLLSAERGRAFVGISTERTSDAVLRAWGMTLHRTQTIKGVAAALSSSASGVVQLDTATVPYERGLESFRDQSNRFRIESDQAPSGRMTPEAWGIVNRYYRERTVELADKLSIDLVEVHREGSQYFLHPDFGMVESDALKARGQSEAGGKGDLVFRVRGGLKSDRQREVEVFGDSSGLISREPFRLRDFGRSGREELARAAYEWLAPGLRQLIPQSDEDRGYWQAVLQDEAPDYWPEAREMAERSEARKLADTVDFLLEVNGLAGTKGEVKRERAELLHGIFGVMDRELLLSIPIALLRDGVRALESHLKERRAA